MKINPDWLRSPASQAVTAMLQNAGHQVYFVGGCVRNAVLHRAVADLDLCTDARPEQVMQLAQAAGLRAIPTGIDHGTVTVVSGGRPYEITTFRKDVKTDGRHAVVAFSGSMEQDALRRDFTMNALYAAPDGTVHDPVAGMPDLVAGRVRFINDPGERIREDYLRILRFFRFYAWYGDPNGGIDADGLAACAGNLDGLDGLARERVGAEICKLLCATNPAPAMAAMAASGVLHRILPGVDVAGLAPLVHFEAELSRPAHLHTRLAALNPDNAQAALRLDNADTLEMSRIRDGATGGTTAAALGYALGYDLAVEALMLRAVLSGDRPDQVDMAAAQFGAAQVFPIKAADLMPDLSGPALGARLKTLEAGWIASGFNLSKSDLLGLP